MLEVGCGNGLNLLDARLPISGDPLRGRRAHRGRVCGRRAVQAEAELPDVLRRFAPEPLVDAARIARSRSISGAPARCRLADARVRSRLLVARARADGAAPAASAHRDGPRCARATRSCSSRSGFTNDRGLRRDYLLTRDHFRGRIDELPSYGLDPILVSDDLPGRSGCSPASVVCRKRAAAIVSEARAEQVGAPDLGARGRQAG